MKRAVVREIIIRMSAIWGLIFLGLYFLIRGYRQFYFLIIPFALVSLPETFIWVRIIIDVCFSKPRVIYTKKLRYISNTPVNLGRGSLTCKNCYSIIKFTDDRLKGTYYMLEPVYFKQGVELKIVYYPRSKYITQMEYSEPPSN